MTSIERKNQNMTKNNGSSSDNHSTGPKPLSETDPKAAKEKQAKEKLEMLETFRAIQNGELPPNEKIDDMLEKLMNNTVVSSREHKMSQDGKLLLQDFRQLLQTLRNALQVKNKDELFQSYVHHLYLLESPIKKEHITGSVDQSHKDATKEEGKKNYQAFVKIGKLLVLNNEFRSILGELIDLSQNIFSNVTGNLSDSLRNAGDQLEETSNNPNRRSGKEYVDDLLVGSNNKNGQSAEEEEPHLIDSRAKDPQHAGLLNTGDSVHPDLLPMNNKKEENGRLDSTTHENTLANSSPTTENNNGAILEEGKDTAKKHANKHKENFTKSVKENFTKEKQDELLHRLRKAVAQIQSHPDYQDAVNTIIELFKNWTNRLSDVTSNVKDNANQKENADEQAQLRKQSQTELKTIIETWGQGKSLDSIVDALKDVRNDARQDEELREYYRATLDYVKRLVNEPNYVNKDESTRDGRQLTDTGKRLMKGKYGDHFNHLSKLVRSYLKEMAQDETAREINQCVTKIHQDLWMDSDGNPAFKPHLLNDMRMTLLPAFLDEIRYIPVPRVEYSDKQYDITVDNLVISGDTLLPNIFETKMENYYSFNLKSEVEDDNHKESHQTLFVRMSEIQANIDDVNFSYKKKTGFPKISDRGIASVYVIGKGITVSMRIKSANDDQHTFKVTHLKCNVDNIKIKVSESNHDILYKAVGPIVTGMIKKQIARAIENKIRLSLESLDRRITTSIHNMNQSLQEKAQNALPESERAKQQQPMKPGFFNTVVTIINRNIKTKVENRNESKRQKSLKRQSTSPSKRRSFFSLDRKNTPSARSHDTSDTEVPSTNGHHEEPSEMSNRAMGNNGVLSREAVNDDGFNQESRPTNNVRPSFQTADQSVDSHNSLPGSFPKANKQRQMDQERAPQHPPPTPTHFSREQNAQQL